jgi:hypothetical protein
MENLGIGCRAQYIDVGVKRPKAKKIEFVSLAADG